MTSRRDISISRRQFLSGAAAFVAGASLSPLAKVKDGSPAAPARAVDDPRVEHSPVVFRSGDVEIDGHLACPKRGSPSPGILVLPGNWIVEPYIPEFVSQLAQVGFVALAVNIYHQFPKVKTWEEARAVPGDSTQKILQERWTDRGMLRDVLGAADFLRRRHDVSPKKLGITGFCGGGWNAILFAADHPEVIGAVVAFYAPPDATQRFNRPRSVLSVLDELQAPLQAHYGTRDPNISLEDIERFRTAVSKSKPPGEVYLYDAGHGFMAYNRDPVYDPKAAKLAFERATAFFHRYLR